MQCQSRSISFFRLSGAEEETPWHRTDLGWGKQPRGSAVPEAALPAVCHLGAMAEPGKTSPLQKHIVNGNRAEHRGPGSLRWPCSCGSFLSPWPEAAAGGRCCHLQFVPSEGDFGHFPIMKGVASWWKVPLSTTSQA